MKRRGFTFLELLVALSLFTVGMLSILQIFPANRRLLAQNAANTQAVFLAQEQLELARATPYANLTVGTYAPRAAITTAAGISGYDRQIVVTYLDSNYATSNTDQGLKRVDVTVYWTDRTINRQYTVSSYVTR